MKKRKMIDILISLLLALIFVWLMIRLRNVYHIKQIEFNELQNNHYVEVPGFHIPWLFLTSPFFILLTYYFIPYFIFVIAFIRKKNSIISVKIAKHKKIYFLFSLVLLSISSYLFYKMVIHITTLYDAFTYFNTLFLLYIHIPIIYYFIAYYLGKYFAYAVTILLNYESST